MSGSSDLVVEAMTAFFVGRSRAGVQVRPHG